MKSDIAFLKTYLAELQASYATASELTEADFAPRGAKTVPETSTEAERVARLADAHGMDGSLFRYMHSYVFDLDADLRNARLQIETIPRIIAAIEQADDAPHRIPDDAEMLTLRDMATLLNMGESTVRQHDKQGKIPRRLKIGGSIRWDRQEMIDWRAAGSLPREVWERRKGSR